MNYNLTDLLWNLSTSIDYLGITDIHHGKRVAYYAAEISGLIDMEWSHEDIIYAALIHDCGVSTCEEHETLVNNFYVEKRMINHCQVGFFHLQGQPLLSHLAEAVLHHHTPWHRLLNAEVSPKNKHLGNLIFLADRVDVLFSRYKNPDKVMEIIEANVNKIFTPFLVEALRQAALRESFWYYNDMASIKLYFQDICTRKEEKMIGIEDTLKISELFSKCIDAKSPFTHEHSQGTMEVAKKLATMAGASSQNIKELCIASLLHDLGKIRVPDEILNKNKELNKGEFNIIKRHSFDSYIILKAIKGFENISRWTVNHHEKLNGRGYPFRKKANKLDLESRVLAIADIFQALVQLRPYRKDFLDKKTIISILGQFVEKGEIDGDLANDVFKNYDEFYFLANNKTDK